jgi:hypothetical protein
MSTVNIKEQSFKVHRGKASERKNIAGGEVHYAFHRNVDMDDPISVGETSSIVTGLVGGTNRFVSVVDTILKVEDFDLIKRAEERVILIFKEKTTSITRSADINPVENPFNAYGIVIAACPHSICVYTANIKYVHIDISPKNVRFAPGTPPPKAKKVNKTLYERLFHSEAYRHIETTTAGLPDAQKKKMLDGVPRYDPDYELIVARRDYHYLLDGPDPHGRFDLKVWMTERPKPPCGTLYMPIESVHPVAHHPTFVEPCDDVNLVSVEPKVFLHPALALHTTFLSEEEAQRYIRNLATTR